MFQLHRLTVLLLSVLLLALVATSCSFPAEPLLQVSPSQPAGEKAVAASLSQDASLEDIAAQGVELALAMAPQVASEISSRYWFALPGTVPWWGPQPIVYETGDRSQGVLRLRFHKQHVTDTGFLSDELALLWQEGQVDGDPGTSFGWAAAAGVPLADTYTLLDDPCTIDGTACQVYRYHGSPAAGDIIWRIWYDEQADLTYALAIPGQEPEVGLAFERDFRGQKE